MIPPQAPPDWLIGRLRAAGGAVPFRTYMEWVLHDPEHGAYGSGRLRVGPGGDFATSPSLGSDFADLLAPQVAQWLEALAAGAPAAPAEGPDLALVEAGPGEGDLAAQLAEALDRTWPALARRCELVLVEPNGGMAARQRQRLAGCPLPVRWGDFPALAARPLRGVVLAHEVLDALAVDRIVWDGRLWRRQEVVLRQGDLLLEAGEPLDPGQIAALETLGVPSRDPRFPGGVRPAGWCTELHPALEDWLGACSGAVAEGHLLVIDYALEARRYYAPHRSEGTLMAYRHQRASADPLLDPGHWDLTAHLCLESLVGEAAASGWLHQGTCRQGEALLALGLAGRLHGLQAQGKAVGLATLLARRETLLRLVDPAGLGDFRWSAFRRGPAPAEGTPAAAPLFLQEPIRGDGGWNEGGSPASLPWCAEPSAPSAPAPVTGSGISP